MGKKIIVGLGNYGVEYKNTRHNMGFIMLDFLAENKQVQFYDAKYAYKTEFMNDDNVFILLKPTTFVNNSGLAVKYWSNFYKIRTEDVFVLVDDLNLNFGEIRFKLKGGNGGHNGLKNIEENIGTNYPRLRFGIGKNFEPGQQSNFVLSKFTEKEFEYILKSKNTIVEKIKIYTNC